MKFRMMEKNNLFDISNLSSDEVDFYNYCLKNIEMLTDLTLKEIAQSYGCGISFIYRYFEKLNVSGLKEYIFKLGYWSGFKSKYLSQTSEETLIKNGEESLKNEVILKVEDEILMNYRLSYHNNFDVLKKQTKEMIELSQEIKKANKIYGFGAGHAFICVDDLFGMLKIFGLRTEIFNKETFENILNRKIYKDDIFLIYSMRGKSKYLEKLITILKRIAPDNKIFLVTSNPKAKLVPFCSKSFLICNNTRQTDYLNNPLLISSASPFLLFNDFLKNIYYLENKDVIATKEIFIKELETWRDISKSIEQVEFWEEFNKK